MPVIVSFIVLGIVIFLLALYMVVKAAVNHSEALKEIKILLMQAQNEKYRS